LWLIGNKRGNKGFLWRGELLEHLGLVRHRILPVKSVSAYSVSETFHRNWLIVGWMRLAQLQVATPFFPNNTVKIELPHLVRQKQNFGVIEK
jgi:hypothetical protein